MKKWILFIGLLPAVLLLLGGCSEQNATNPADFSDMSVLGSTSAYPLAESEEPPISMPAGPVFILDGPGPFLFEALDLTEEQKASLHEIALSYREKLEDLRSEIRTSGLTREEIHNRHMMLREEMYEEMKTVLTEEQKALLTEIESQIDQGIYPEILIQKRIAHMTTELGLSEEQQTALTRIFSEYGTRLLALRGVDLDMRALHDTARAIMDEMHRAIVAVLDETQIALLEEQMQKHRPVGQNRRPGFPH